MRLYFLRHTDAADAAHDDIRPLSDLGRADARKIGLFLKRTGVSLDAAYASPLLRAQETAQLVVESSGSSIAIQTAPSLRNESNDFQSWLLSIPEKANTLLVGHLPSIAERAGSILSVKHPSSLFFTKGAMACVETENRRTGVIRFFVRPEIL